MCTTHAGLVVLVLVLSMTVGCSNSDRRNRSELIDKLDGVWVYPKEQPGETTITVIKDMKRRTYDYSPTRIDPRTNWVGEMPVWGEGGVYFFPNEVSYNSPQFFLTNQGQKFFILNKHAYDRYVKDGKIPLQIWIRVANTLDFAKPPERPSIEVLGLPYDDVFRRKQ